jgi:biotin transport system substrate-specific component
VAGASVIISLFGPISIPLPFTPVPINTQGNVILFLAVLLGPRRGALAVLAYLAQGAMGLPVFSAGRSGLPHLLGPTGGYLFSYAAAAFVTGFLVEKVFKRTQTNALYAMGVGNLIIYLFGVPWLSVYCGWNLAFKLGMFPFLAGDLLKLVLAGKLLKSLSRFTQTI